MNGFKFSTTLPGGVSFLISIHNDLSQAQRKSLLRRIFRQLKPVLREIGSYYADPKFDPRLDPRSAIRTAKVGSVGKSHELEAIRTRLGISQFGLSQISGVSRFQISRIEQGKIPGSPKTWQRIHESLVRNFPQLLNQKMAVSPREQGWRLTFGPTPDDSAAGN